MSFLCKLGIHKKREYQFGSLEWKVCLNCRKVLDRKGFGSSLSYLIAEGHTERAEFHKNYKVTSKESYALVSLDLLSLLKTTVQPVRLLPKTVKEERDGLGN